MKFKFRYIKLKSKIFDKQYKQNEQNEPNKLYNNYLMQIII